ncbi:MAG: homoserine dehydrogenase [Candidatus Binatus sp.]|uniref:homoserine dehydrogenase n=1 Tax=Candidatus Binatus sp. TaxID=2811406 RepID=UPI00271882B0|nr:homoserine dehydrogenase [Candidatus Binatus sp.]MDO8434538.1 homoserine dehydrogenase [Candidatus Binatus sp.]
MRIALLGCGTVGGGVVKLMRRNAAIYERKLGAPLELAVIADRSLKPDPSLGITAKLISRDNEATVARPDVDIVVELFGGKTPARELILRALGAGKDVVTGNKALLAEHGDEIFRVAGKRGLSVGFEASVGGGVPIIRILRDSLAGDRQRAVYGIVNGTCNSILTTMTETGVEFASALADAQATGLAEANPALDIEGHDAAHKLCLLVTLAFGVGLKPRQVYTEGITRITQSDIEYARELGYAIKLLAIAKDDDGAIEARVHPTMIPNRHLLAGVGGAYNAIYIHGEALGSTMCSGLGAGQMPTATAVMADILEIARRRLSGSSGASNALGLPAELIERASVKPMDDVVCEYYLRFMARDKPGVLGAIASVLGRHGLSIASVIQKGRGAAQTVPVIMRTHEAPERSLKRALAEIRRKRIVQSTPAFIRIEENL